VLVLVLVAFVVAVIKGALQTRWGRSQAGEEGL